MLTLGVTLAAYFLVCVGLRCAPVRSRPLIQLVAERQYRLRQSRADNGLFVTAMVALFDLPSLLPGLSHSVLKARLAGRVSDRDFIDSWHVSYAILGIAAYSLLDRASPLVLIPFSRFFDLTYTLLCLNVQHTPPRRPIRSLMLLLLHYVELVVVFASLYYLLAFYCLVQFNVAYPGKMQILYFSFITASTIGYGDVFVKEDGWPLTVIVGEVITFAFITFIALPRNLTFMSPPPIEKPRQ